MSYDPEEEKRKAEAAAGLKKAMEPSYFDRLMKEKHMKRRARMLRRNANGPKLFLENERIERKKKEENRKKNKAAKAARRRNRK